MRPRNHISATVQALLSAAVLCLLAAGASADPAQSLAAAQAALQGVGNGVSPETLQNAARGEGYDWSLLLALIPGIIGLVWIRRHVANL